MSVIGTSRHCRWSKPMSGIGCVADVRARAASAAAPPAALCLHPSVGMVERTSRTVFDLTPILVHPPFVIFRLIRKTMPLQYVTAFLLVAQEEGLSVSEYARRANVSVSVMSRHLLDIGDRTRRGEEGFGLVTARMRPENMREHEYVLTPKGRALWAQIVTLME